jgi:hypothetical protein
VTWLAVAGWIILSRSKKGIGKEYIIEVAIEKFDFIALLMGFAHAGTAVRLPYTSTILSLYYDGA